MIAAVLLGLWMGTWALGGIWLAGAAFRLDRGERLVVGLVVGLALENLLANLLARLLPLPAAAWIAAGLTGLAGLAAVLARKTPLLPRLSPILIPLALLSLLAFGLGRGYGLFDEFLQLPTISLMAAGDIPPRFALDPAVPYEYHYYLLFTAAQAMRIGEIPPWGALDLLRGLTTGLALCLAFAWTRRMTRSAAAGVLGAAFLYFVSGARWFLLLLPQDWLRTLSSGLELLGSGAASGPDLAAALAGPWVIDGVNAIPFPFAFGNGIQPPGVLLQFVANGLTEQAFLLALLLVFSRRSGWLGDVLCAVIVSAMALLTEAGVILEVGGLGLAALIVLARGRSLRLPRSLWVWMGVVAGGHLLSSWQGGALWGIILRAIGLTQSADYHTIGFKFVFPPTLVSMHLGVLSIGSPGQLLIALAEAGPLLLVFPLLLIFGWKAVRAGRWMEASLAGEAALGFLVLFVQFTGSEGVRNTARMYRFPFVLVLFAVPLGWNWLKNRGPAWRWTAAALAGTGLLGGVALFSAQLPALQKPVYSYFIDVADAAMYERQWNRLEPGELVFDLVQYRAPTLFGRYTNSSRTWYELKPEWKALFLAPTPRAIRAGGFRYAYFDNHNFGKLSLAVRDSWDNSCAELIEETQSEWGWRRLYDLNECR